MLKYLEKESWLQPRTHKLHLSLVRQLLHVLHDESQVEYDQDQETILEILLVVSNVILQTQRCKEQEMVDKVAQEIVKLFMHVYTAELLI